MAVRELQNWNAWLSNHLYPDFTFDINPGFTFNIDLAFFIRRITFCLFRNFFFLLLFMFDQRSAGRQNDWHKKESIRDAENYDSHPRLEETDEGIALGEAEH